MSNIEYTVDVEVTEDITPAVDTGDATSSSVDDERIFLSADIDPDELVDAEVNTNEMIDITVRESVGSTETDHRLLTHRDAPDQHPMSAITGLNTSLQNMSASIDSRLTADENGIILLQAESDGHSQRLDVVEDDVVDAAKTATNYVTALNSNGIRLHAEDSATLNYINLNGDGMEVFKGAKSVANFGELTRIGSEDGYKTTLTSGGMNISSTSGVMFDVSAAGSTYTRELELFSWSVKKSGHVTRYDDCTLDLNVEYTFKILDWQDGRVLDSEIVEFTSTDDPSISVKNYLYAHGNLEMVTLEFSVTNEDRINCHIRQTTDTVVGDPIKCTYTGTYEVPAIHFSGTNNLLWSGSMQMTGGQTIDLAESVDSQLSGIVLVWSAYKSGALDKGWHTTFVPKSMVMLLSSVEVSTGLMTVGNSSTASTAIERTGAKYVTVTNNTIAGTSENGYSENGTSMGKITYDNTKWVLRYVFGV